MCALKATSWVKGNRWLNDTEMKNNAEMVYKYFKRVGWSLNAISAMLGNMQVESTINPGIWENLVVEAEGRGFGLVQWTPWTNYTNWADSKGYTWDDGSGQCYWIAYETKNYGQWLNNEYISTAYPMTFDEFIVSTESPEYLADVFLRNFERPADLNQPIRQTYARQWYNYLIELDGEPTPTPIPVPKRKRKPMFFNSKTIVYILKRRF